jgi:hypothetical protein
VKLRPIRDLCLRHGRKVRACTHPAISGLYARGDVTTIMVRQSGQLAPLRKAEAELYSAIPRHIVQFWDRDPTYHVRELMASWRKLNPGHRWTGFDDGEARAFIKDEFGAEILTAYACSAVQRRRPTYSASPILPPAEASMPMPTIAVLRRSTAGSIPKRCLLCTNKTTVRSATTSWRPPLSIR